MALRVLEIGEQRDCWFPRAALSIDEAMALTRFREAGIEVGWPNPVTGDRWRLRARGWVGVVPVGGDLLVRIRPKLPMDRLLGLLLWSQGLQDLHVFDGIAPSATIEECFGIVLDLLAQRVSRRVAQGLRKEYVTTTFRGASPRGRIRFRDSVKLFASGRPIVAWEERPLTVDTLDNRLLAWALPRAARSPAVSPETRAELTRLGRLLAGWTSVQAFRVDDYLRRVKEAADDGYAALHALCALILLGAGPSQENGTAPFLPYGIDVPTVFQNAAFHLIAEALPHGLTVSAEPVLPLGSGMRFQPDIVVHDTSGRAIAVLDSKYKTSLEQGDVQQILAYATALRCTDAFLIYPTRLGIGELMAGDVKLRTLSLDPSEDLRAGARNLIAALTSSNSAAPLAPPMTVNLETAAASIP
jgi:5-methylcytosine-specific restriction enzyme subunit McrC